jgi:hypothetical protein
MATMMVSEVIWSLSVTWPPSPLSWVVAHLSQDCRPWVLTELEGELEVRKHDLIFWYLTASSFGVMLTSLLWVYLVHSFNFSDIKQVIYFL